ncbi:hypothetical protein GALL_188610 [mine drainage metagenome]|uniref:Uncharacterized protein n=1 Tax=mine drainage metagenome TaxID=410659 RepID=A0A1J5S4F2_9ZZZZ
MIATLGGNIANPSLHLPNSSDEIVEFWPNQKFDWNIQSMAYCIYVANPEINFIFPQNFPRAVHNLRFKHLQLIVMYWAIDKPTKGASSSIQLFSPPTEALAGLQLQEAVDFTYKLTETHIKQYELLPELLPDQLPKTWLQNTHVKVVLTKWHFKKFSYGLESNRDESLLRLKFNNEDGNEAVIDFTGEDITKFQESLNMAINSNPGLAMWKRQP